MNTEAWGKKPHKRMIGAFKNFFSAFDRWSEPKEGDTSLTLAGKKAIKFMGIALMILLSPFLMIGLTIAFIAVF